MDQERHETYERIPWEALDAKRPDPNRLVIIVAVAIALGALAFSFMRNQPAPPPATIAAEVAASSTTVPVAPTTVPTVATSPMIVSEADLYAVDTGSLADAAVAHAEWFAVEYVSVDGSDVSRSTLVSLLPAGVPVPEAPEGTQVFVDWVGAVSVTETASFTYEVEVLVRSLVSGPDGLFTRQPPRRLVVEVAIGPDGLPRVTRPPVVADSAVTATPLPITLGAIPEQLETQIETSTGPVIGGEPLADGRWRVVVMAEDTDGVRRPRTVISP